MRNNRITSSQDSKIPLFKKSDKIAPSNPTTTHSDPNPPTSTVTTTLTQTTFQLPNRTNPFPSEQTTSQTDTIQIIENPYSVTVSADAQRTVLPPPYSNAQSLNTTSTTTHNTVYPQLRNHEHSSDSLLNLTISAPHT